MTSNTFPLSLAPTGMVPRRNDSPHVPLTPHEIADQVLECAEVGVTSVHLHARDVNGDPVWQKEYYAEIIYLIRASRPEIVICVSTSGRSVSDVKKRSDVLDLEGDLRPEMGSLTLASMNFAQSASVNSPETVQYLASAMLERGIVPELEVFDTGMVNYLSYLIHKGFLKAPFVVNLILGGIATAQLHPLELGLLLQRLPEESLWSVGGIGRAQLPANLLGLAAGGGVRVGLEDNLHLDDARAALATNKKLVERVVTIAELMGKRVMSSTEFRRQVLG